MNEDNKEAIVWACESEGAIALFEGEIPSEDCQETAKCSWCHLKWETRRSCRANSLVPSDGPNSTWGFETRCDKGAEGDKCKFCLMGQQEWEEYASEKMKQLEAEVKGATNAYLLDGIAKLNEMKCRGLDSHNMSIDLCIAAFTDIFNMGADEQNWVMRATHHVDIDVPYPNPRSIPPTASMTSIWAYEDEDKYGPPGMKKICIEFRGKESGIKYRIAIKYFHERATKLAGRIDDLVQANSLYPASDAILRGFVVASDFLDFQVSREDTDGGWDYLCIDPSGDFGVWPGDDVATLIMCLFDDLKTALDPAMYTLRHGLDDASKNAFLNGNSKASIHRLMAYDAAYESIIEATKQMPTEDVHSLVSKLKQNFSDPDFAKEARPGFDEAMLQEGALEGEWHE